MGRRPDFYRALTNAEKQARFRLKQEGRPLFIPVESPEELVCLYGQIAPLGKYESLDIVSDPEKWTPEVSTLGAMHSAYIGIKSYQERMHEAGRTLGPAMYRTAHAMMAVQARAAECLANLDMLWPEFMKVVQLRTGDEGWLLPFPPPASDYPSAPEGMHSGSWGAAIAVHRLRWAHAALSWRQGAKSWLIGAAPGFEKLDMVPNEVTSAQSSMQTARAAIRPERMTAQERSQADMREGNAMRALQEALSRRRRDASRSADVSSRNMMMRGSK